MSSRYKTTQYTSDLQSLISDAYGELQSLRDEAQEIVDNVPDSLRQTERIQTFESTVSNLDGCDSEPDVPKGLGDVPVTYSEQTKRGPASRAVRCGNAVSMITAAVDMLKGHARCKEDEVEELCGTLEEMASNADSCEWPGMFG